MVSPRLSQSRELTRAIYFHLAESTARSQAGLPKLNRVVQGEGLKEGMFLNARLSADPVKSAFSIPRRLLIDGNKVFVVEQDSLLKMKAVDIVRYTKDQAIVKGLSEDALLVNQVMSGAYTDMRVKALK